MTGASIRAVGDKRRGYGSPTAVKTLHRLKRMGVNTIGVLMEGRMINKSAVHVQPPSTEEMEGIKSVLDDARKLGLATVLIPHLYIDDGTWRGAIRFSEAAQRDAWWRSYGAFILLASTTAAASSTAVLSVGVELKAMSKDADTNRRMLQLIEQVRGQYHGLLTYSANWDEAEQVSFWNAVDLAGVNAYYPLEPDPVRGAESVARRLSKLSHKVNKEVLIVEVGYRSSPLSHLRPWQWPDEVDPIVDDESQARAWAAVLGTWLETTGVRGLLFWVVPTDPDDPASEPRHGFNPLNKRAEQVITRAFLSR